MATMTQPTNPPIQGTIGVFDSGVGGLSIVRALIEAAWQYRLVPKVSEAMQRRQQGQRKEVRMIAWQAQQRLHKRFQQLGAKKKRVVAATAVARELAGFVWAIARQVKPASNAAAPQILRTCRGKVYRLDASKKMPKTQ